MRLKLVVGAFLALAVGLWSASAMADPTISPLCHGPETGISGSYHNLVITGNEGVATGTTLSVSGNLIIAPGACLDAFSMGTVNVGGNVLVQNGAILALGCALDAAMPPTPCTASTSDSVGGSIIATDPWTMYLTASTIGGNVVSTGGGPGPTTNPYVNFPIKDNTIQGNLIVQGWQGAWFGAFRNTVQGNVIVQDVVGATDGGEFGFDSNEVATNTISGNLICQGNSPAMQFGDSGGAPNVVSGNAIGQCGFDVIQPDENYPPGIPQPISVRPS